MVTILGLGIAAGMGTTAYFTVLGGYWAAIAGLLWLVFAMWQMIPVMAASFQESLDLTGLLRFPVSFGSYCLLWLVFGLADISTMLGAICLFGLWVGLALAAPGAALFAAPVLLVFAAMNVLLARVIFAWLDRWLAQRKTREILGAIFFVLVLSLQLMNPAIWHFAGAEGLATKAVARQFAGTVYRAQGWFPAGVVAHALESGVKGQVPGALGRLGLLALYTAVPAGLLAARLRAQYAGENLGEAPKAQTGARTAARTKAQEKKRIAASLLAGVSVAASLSGQSAVAAARLPGGSAASVWNGISAVLEKELRTVQRSAPLLYALIAPLFILVVIGMQGAGRGGRSPFASVGQYMLPFGITYAFLGLTRLVYNCLGTEGAGVQMYFLSPTPIRTVLLGKNFFQAILFVFEAGIVFLAVHLRFGLPQGELLAATLCWLVFALAVHLTVGNAFSLTMPYRVNLARMGRQQGGTANGLLSLLVHLGVLGVGAAVYLPAALLGYPWAGAIVLLLLAGGAVFAWIKGLDAAEGMLARHLEELTHTLARPTE